MRRIRNRPGPPKSTVKLPVSFVEINLQIRSNLGSNQESGAVVGQLFVYDVDVRDNLLVHEFDVEFLLPLWIFFGIGRYQTCRFKN